MSTILVKIFATALTLAQVTTRPDAIKTEFQPGRDAAEVVRLLRDGCAHMRKAFDIEDINIDELIAVAMDDPQAVAGDAKILQGLQIGELNQAYKRFCKNEDGPEVVNLNEVIATYNKAVANLPDHATLKGRQLPGISTVVDGSGARFAEVFEPDHRRVWVALKDIPLHVRQAFVAAEDKRFFEHKGIDERGVIRAFMGNMTAPGRPQGGSTITQQVAKNLLVGDDVTYDRKMREMIVASRLERTLAKDEILEIYLNAIYLGRSSWGIETAAKSYFGKSARELNVAEGAFLAALTKGPNYYDPDRHPDRARERLAYVVTRLKEDGHIGAPEAQTAIAALPKLVPLERTRRDSGFHLVDHLGREVRTAAGLESLTAATYTIRSTINAPLQRVVESTLQEQLARYELSTGRLSWRGPQGNLAEGVKRLEAAGPDQPGPAWQRALKAWKPPLYDVHWPAAVVLDLRGKGVRVGLADGRVLPLTTWSAAIRRSLKPHDVVHVRVAEGGAAQPGKKARAARAELRVPPTVQGAAVVLENKTGRILAMSGGFSYPASQLNRVTQTHRQPGSALKPISYLAALGRGLQPNTLIWDAPVTLPPVTGELGARRGDYWTPKNYDGGGGGLMTLRRALENSKNLVTARLLDGAITDAPDRSLKKICELALEAQLYVECVPHYPFILGAQPLRVLDLAAFYSAIANEGARPSPYALEAVEQSGRAVYRREAKPLVQIASADRVAFYQMKTILQGVLERGTARSIRHLAPFVGGKTGTTDGENDAWFAGFTNEVSIAVWVGYDNADGKRRTLGRGQTGGKLAVPIFEQIVQAAWTHHQPRTALSPPSPEAQRQIMAMPINLQTGDRIVRRGTGGRVFVEHFRMDGSGRFDETQYALVPRSEVYAMRDPGLWVDGESVGGGLWDDVEPGPFAQAPQRREDPSAWRYYGQQPYYEDQPRRRPRRVDPDYLWGGRLF